ncbi:MAG: hypothetical protein DHS20C05_06170 [Hyphococcus sp.]|nr:MAG: hypothetical protein DHS20C05_06170 [Marinicaulis sp.]
MGAYIVMKNILVLVVIAVLAFGGWYFYQESQKSDLEKAAEDMADSMEDAAENIADELD